MKSDKHRIVVTGVGMITPVGNSTPDTWQSIKAGKHGIAPLTRYDVTQYISPGKPESALQYTLAAEVKNFDALNYMDRPLTKRLSRYSQYAVAASREALNDAAFDIQKEDAFRCGVIVGVGMGGLNGICDNYYKLAQRGPGAVNPLTIPMVIPSMAAGNVSIVLGFKGKSYSPTAACATGTIAIGEAARSIANGEIDVAVAGGSEGAISPIGYTTFAALHALAKTNDPDRASIPFDKERSGFVMGEGAGVLLLESLEHARKRGAKIYCELKGYGTSSDAYHMTMPDPNGEGAARCMKAAIMDAGLESTDITYINAHGTSTLYNDWYETVAIKKVFGEHAKKLLINSTKAFTGHGLGCAGGIEAGICAKSISEGWVHGTLGLKVPDENCDLNYLAGSKGKKVKVNAALSNSFAFGGHNASLVFTSFDEKD